MLADSAASNGECARGDSTKSNFTPVRLNTKLYKLLIVLSQVIACVQKLWNRWRIFINLILKMEKGLKTFLFNTVDDNKSIIIRVIVGLIFLTEGIQKFLFPELLGTGRFLKIGFTHPAFWAYFTGAFEIICSVFILIGLLIRLFSIPLMITMITAFITTKWPILIEKGFWVFAHEYRTDFAMTLLLLYLLIYGSGNWSIDSGIKKSLKT